MALKFPYQIDRRGRTAASDADAHVRELIEQVLFTSPGERIGRPNFGSDLLRLTFSPTDTALAAATQLTVQAALQQWLSELAQIQEVVVEATNAVVLVTVRYVVLRSQKQQVVQFEKEV